MRLPDKVFDRYLAVLGISKTKPDRELLETVTSAHLIRVPFENISKIHRARVKGKRDIPPLEEFLDGVERLNLGGTCYVNNYYLHLLLAYLGFDARLCGADIAAAGASPNGHMVNIVTLGACEFIVDVGYGAPFWKPIPRDRSADVVYSLGSERYIFKPIDMSSRTRLELYRNDQISHGYLLKPEPKMVEDFAGVIAQSYDDNAPFLNSLVLARFFDNRALFLKNHQLTEQRHSGAVVQYLKTSDDIKNAIVKYFEMPDYIVRESMDSLPDIRPFGS